jgi:hypothetical protein
MFFSFTGYPPSLAAIPTIGKPRQFPAIPVQPGTFSILPEKCRFGTENNAPDQTLAGKFP